MALTRCGVRRAQGLSSLNGQIYSALRRLRLPTKPADICTLTALLRAIAKLVGSPRDAAERDVMRGHYAWAAQAVATVLDGTEGTPEEKACLGASGAQMAARPLLPRCQ